MTVDGLAAEPKNDRPPSICVAPRSFGRTRRSECPEGVVTLGSPRYVMLIAVTGPMRWVSDEGLCGLLPVMDGGCADQCSMSNGQGMADRGHDEGPARGIRRPGPGCRSGRSLWRIADRRHWSPLLAVAPPDLEGVERVKAVIPRTNGGVERREKKPRLAGSRRTSKIRIRTGEGRRVADPRAWTTDTADRTRFRAVTHVGLFGPLHERRAAQLDGHDDALLVHDGNVLEGPTWNIGFYDGEHRHQTEGGRASGCHHGSPPVGPCPRHRTHLRRRARPFPGGVCHQRLHRGSTHQRHRQPRADSRPSDLGLAARRIRRDPARTPAAARTITRGHRHPLDRTRGPRTSPGQAYEYRCLSQHLEA